MTNLNTVLTEIANNGNVKFIVPESERFYNNPVTALDLDNRSKNAVLRSGAKTVGDVIENLDFVKGIRGCGTKSINKILYAICAFYYNSLDEVKRKAYLMRLVELNYQS